MKKIILSIALFAINASVTTANAAVENTFSQQLAQQKTQLRPQEFNFFSDRYKQVQAHNINTTTVSFKQQLLKQKTQLRPQEFNFFSDRYKQVTAQTKTAIRPLAVVNLSFKDQLLQQKSQLRSQEFNFFSDRYKQVNAHAN